MDPQFSSSVLENLSLFSYLETPGHVVQADSYIPLGFSSAPGEQWQPGGSGNSAIGHCSPVWEGGGVTLLGESHP